MQARLGRVAILAAALLVAACQPPVASPAPTMTFAPLPTLPVPTVAEPTPSPRAPDLRLVTIGDSIPFGGADCGGCATFTDLWAAAIEGSTGLVVEARNLSSHDSLTGARLVDRLETSASMRDAVAAADIVVVTIGHNDTPWNATDDDCDGDSLTFTWMAYSGACVADLATRHEQELDRVLDMIDTLRDGLPTAVRVTTDYNDIVGWFAAPPAATEPSIEVLDAFFAATCRAADMHQVPCVDVYHSFNGPQGRGAAGPLIADDDTHPSALGQRRIAELLIATGLDPLPLASSPPASG